MRRTFKSLGCYDNYQIREVCKAPSNDQIHVLFVVLYFKSHPHNDSLNNQQTRPSQKQKQSFWDGGCCLKHKYILSHNGRMALWLEGVVRKRWPWLLPSPLSLDKDFSIFFSPDRGDDLFCVRFISLVLQMPQTLVLIKKKCKLC